MAEIFVCVVFWSGVLWMFGAWVYSMSWRERRALVVILAIAAAMFWAEAHFGISFPE